MSPEQTALAASLVLGFTLGLDSLRVCCALGLQPLSAQARTRIAVAFGVCDGLAVIIGLAVGSTIIAVDQYVQAAAWLFLAAYGAWLVWRVPEQSIGPRGLWLPVVLSLDNLTAGLALSGSTAAPLLSALVIGSMSGVMATVGLFAGRLVRNALPVRAHRLGGLALVGIAFAQAVGAG